MFKEKLRTIIIWITAPLCLVNLTSCDKNELEELNDATLLFGHFYGECLGESCVEIYKLDAGKLLEDINDKYPNPQEFYKGDFYELTPDKYSLVNDLLLHFPKKLLDETKITFGCPDCADQGGLYIEFKSNKIHKHWLIDQSKTKVPDYLHEFMDMVNEKIDMINE